MTAKGLLPGTYGDFIMESILWTAWKIPLANFEAQSKVTVILYSLFGVNLKFESLAYDRSNNGHRQRF